MRFSTYTGKVQLWRKGTIGAGTAAGNGFLQETEKGRVWQTSVLQETVVSVSECLWIEFACLDAGKVCV